MATIVDWEYIESVMGSTVIIEDHGARRKYLEDRGFDVRSIVLGLMQNLSVYTSSRMEALLITGAMMSGIEMAVRVAESKELDDQLEQ
jgi:hypothetical protein